jgi:hypothetical protein
VWDWLFPDQPTSFAYFLCLLPTPPHTRGIVILTNHQSSLGQADLLYVAEKQQYLPHHFKVMADTPITKTHEQEKSITSYLTSFCDTGDFRNEDPKIRESYFYGQFCRSMIEDKRV